MSPFLMLCVKGTEYINLPHSSSGNQSNQVFMVVVLSCGLVFLMTAHLDLRIPSAFGACANALRSISMQHETDLPLPTGPRSPRKKESSFINAFTIGPGAL